MKNFSLLLLVAANIVYAADSGFKLSDDIIATGDAVAKVVSIAAQEQAAEPLSGTVFDFYEGLGKTGYREYMANNPHAVAKALDYLALLSDKESANSDVQAAVSAFEEACALPKNADVQTIEAWKKELKAFSIALIKTVSEEVSPDFKVTPGGIQRILQNNGKVFKKEDSVAMGGGALAVLAGFERRKNAMSDEAFKILVADGQFLNSPAHHTIASIAAK